MRVTRVFQRNRIIRDPRLPGHYPHFLRMGLGLDRRCGLTTTVLGPDFPVRSGLHLVRIINHPLSRALPWLEESNSATWDHCLGPDSNPEGNMCHYVPCVACMPVPSPRHKRSCANLGCSRKSLFLLTWWGNCVQLKADGAINV